MSPGFVEKGVYYGVRVLCFWEDALVFLCGQGDAVSLKPVLSVVVVECVHESFHGLVSARIDVLQVSDVGKGVCAVASAASGYFYFSEHARAFLDDGY